MCVLLAEYGNGITNTRLFKLNDDTYQVIVFNIQTGNEVAEFFHNKEVAMGFAQTRVMLNE